jgi:hypothetical protein
MNRACLLLPLPLAGEGRGGGLRPRHKLSGTICATHETRHSRSAYGAVAAPSPTPPTLPRKRERESGLSASEVLAPTRNDGHREGDAP